MKKIFYILILLPFLSFPQTKRAITVEDLWNMKRIESFDVSPDNKLIVFSAAAYSMEENKGNRDIYLINTDGKDFKVFKNSNKNETQPMFINNGNQISYLLDGQVWVCDLNGANEKQITSIYTGVNDYRWSDNYKKLLFTSSVYPDCQTDDCNKVKDDKESTSKVKAKIFDELFFRHWNEWRGDKRSHLFVLDLDKNVQKDLTPGSKYDIPTIALGSSNDINFSPDGNEISYTANTSKVLATSTNNDIYSIDLTAGQPKSVLITESKGNDNQPVYSPDGKYIAFTSMARAGYEADKLNLVIYDRTSKKLKNITADFKLSVGEIIWANDSRSIYFISETEIYNPVYKIDINSGKIEKVYSEQNNSQIKLSADGTVLYFLQQRANLPFEIFSYNLKEKKLNQVTQINAKLLAELEMNPAETFWSTGADGAKVQSIIVKPPFFDANKKYPVVFLIHGGPQGNWADDFHYRWNTQMFASKGYVVVATNPRGSTGYGHKFTEEISKDWGGKAYKDLMNAFDYALNKFKFIDKKNTFAAGASYGGYMINWLEGHTSRFNAVVSHDGVFNLESMYGTTEEVWFPEWENGGTPWQNRKLYEKYSPHRYIQNAKTPMLIVQGALDFRVPEEQAFQLFTSLQRLGVESKLLYFPDEFHFVTKPQNARLWWNTIFDWFNKHLK
ncbi:MAG: S9 family peptidase [Bacteroidota bacterium]|nr:S9 family peptidase [Bacteroidota bacterium]